MKLKNKVKKSNNKKINLLIDYLKCYKECYLKKQIILFIICLVIFFIAFTIGMSTIDFNKPFSVNINEFANIKLIQTQFIFVMILTPFLALIPFIKNTSLLTIFYSYFMAFNVCNMFYLPTCNKVLLSIFVILSLFVLSINLVLSFVLSENVTKKFAQLFKVKKENDNENNKEKNETYKKDNVFEKENKYLCLRTNLNILMIVICMIITIINLIITKFI